MIECGSLEVAQARLQSRHGQRAGEAAWQRLETAREFGALLDVARRTALRPWLVGIGTPASAHQIEAVLRAHWRKAVAEIAGWMPAPWQPAVQWCAVLADLPVLQYLARAGEPLPWMHDDPDYRPLCAVPPGQRTAAVASGKFRPLAAAWSEPASLAHAWQTAWERRVPQRTHDAEDSLSQIAGALLAHGNAFAAAAPSAGALLRRSLQARLSLLLRRVTLEPAAVFIHIALCAIDFERLRGELLRRALFPHGQVA
jgi:hypothetical protein